MTMRFFFVLFIMSAGSVAAAGQTRTVTNLDLAKYEKDRVAAERELRENYVKLGFASPEERAKRDARSFREVRELSARLRNERLLSETAAAQVEQQRAQQARYNAYIRSLSYSYGQPNGGYDYGFGYGGFPVWYPQRGGQAWRADGSGIVYEPGGRPSSIYTPNIRPVTLPRFRGHR